MHISSFGTKVFAVHFLIFAIVISSQAQTASIFRLEPGTRMVLSMHTPVGSEFSSVDDTFEATVIKPVWNGGRVMLQPGTIVTGRVAKARPSGHGGKPGELDLEFYSIRTPDGHRRDIDGVLVDQRKPKSRRVLSVFTAIGATALGFAIGTASGSTKGSLIGTGVGAAVGTGTGVMITGDEIMIKADQEIEIELKAPVVLPVTAV